ncbi:bet1-like SNARE 1-2 isoform X2 [Prosopis cineraria]|nr:bet1-like SNARE 1-2 isoform X2 [Prosopis cineraria]
MQRLQVMDTKYHIEVSTFASSLTSQSCFETLRTTLCLGCSTIYFFSVKSYLPSQSSYIRDSRSSRSSLFDGYDGLEEGGIRASSSYSNNMNEHDNDKVIESLQDRVVFLKRLTGDIHDEVESHNRLLDQMGDGMDGSRGMMLGTMDRFKKVFEKKSTRKTCSLVAYFTVAFIFIYYLIR